MPEEINQLRTILLKAKNICKHKHDLVVSAADGTKTAELVKIEQERIILFNSLTKPSLFQTENNIDIAELNSKLDLIRHQNVQLQDDYIQKIADFFNFLKDTIMPELQGGMIENLPDQWNIEVMGALKMLRRKVKAKIRFFRDPNNADDLKQIDKDFEAVRKPYREQLSTNTIKAEASDYTVLDNFTNDLKGMIELPPFKSIMVNINEFIKGEIIEGAPIDPIA